MTDLVVTVPRERWQAWLDEGACAGDPPASVDRALEFGFHLYRCERPPIGEGERLYIAAHGAIRGYAFVSAVAARRGTWVIFRYAPAVAVTIREFVPGFHGWRRIWWRRDAEAPFPDWKNQAFFYSTAGRPDEVSTLGIGT